VTTTVSEETFLELAEPLRRELLAHCYRMVGSVHDAEDLVQETYLRAWRAFHGFENRSSVRTWMYRIATNTCLTALDGAKRRPLPTGLGAPPGDPAGELHLRPDVPWLEPLPDDVLWAGSSEDPESEVVTRESVRLAFVAALQHLTGQQRAVLVLRDVLAWHADEVAETLGLSVGAVTSTLQRARAHMAKVDPGSPTRLPEDDPRFAELLNEYVHAFEAYDVDRIAELLTEDATWDMPPYEDWYRGAEAIRRLISIQCPATGPGSMRLLRTSANGAPAVAVYMRGADGVHRAFQLQHLTVTPGGVSAVTAWFDTGLFARFGLPDVLPAPDGAAAGQHGS
jgi:RNA polymerase sigma-70 factor (ECF subfamily)